VENKSARAISEVETNLAESKAEFTAAIAAVTSDVADKLAAAAADAAKEQTKLSDVSDGLQETFDEIFNRSEHRLFWNASMSQCVSPFPPPPPYTTGCKALNDLNEESGQYTMLPEGENEPYDVYCDFSGGGWTLVAKMAKDTASQPKWYYGSKLWTETGVLNPDNATTSPGDHKNRASQVEDRSAKSTRALLNGQNLASQHDRGTWKNWINPFTGDQHGNQPHCNNGAIQQASHGAKCRYGFGTNNENQCNSNDAYIGFGCFTDGGGNPVHRHGVGAFRWNPSKRYDLAGFILVK